MAVELTEKFFADAAGWEAMKQARGLLAADKVLSSNWSPPLLKGVVQEGGISYRAGLAIQSYQDLENICACRSSRQWGTICAHSVAVGLHHLRRLAREAEPKQSSGAAAPVAVRARTGSDGKRVRRSATATEGEPAELYVILSPNFVQAIQQGKGMLFFEGAWKGGRCPLSAMPANQTFRFAEVDSALLDALELLAGGDTPAMLRLGVEDFEALLKGLIGHPRISLGKSKPVTVTEEPWVPDLSAVLDAGGEITLTLRVKGELPSRIGRSWVWQGERLQPSVLPEFLDQLTRGPVRLTRAQVPRFLSQDWGRLQAQGAVQANFRIEDFTVQPQPPRFLLHLVGGLAQLHAQLQCAYGPRVLTVGAAAEGDGFWLPDPEEMTRYSMRDPGAEQAALGRLRAAGFGGPDAQGRYALLGEDRVLNFLAREFPRLQQEWEVTLDERLERSTSLKTERIQPRFEITSSGVQWFDLSVSFEASDGQKFSPAEIQRLLLGGRSHARLRNGRLALIDTAAVQEFQQTLLDCGPEQHGGRYRLAQKQAGFLATTLAEQGWRATAPSPWHAHARQQSGEAQLACPPLGDLESVLRPYQKDGVAWLHFLRGNHFGGILADEMGLGKTLQTLAFLRGTRTEGGGGPCLVVCPTSLVFNWADEARKFTPTLRVLVLQGADRQRRFGEIPEQDLVVTSYALMRRDLAEYRALEFDTVVLDEAQHIKNRQTQNAQAVKAVRARHRLVLTGTPIENSVLDLWSIFDFLMPGYLGTAQDFRERYEGPITRGKDTDAQRRLARRLRPFLRRRLKQEVAKDLPERLEQVAYCELLEDQRALYQQILAASRKEVLDAATAQGAGRSRMVALNALLRLRQVCCDPRLLKTGAAYEEATAAATASSEELPRSGKVELFGELMEEILDGGHRVLVFSQFVSMLSLLRQTLEREGVEYCYLDGSTQNRGEVVSRFQSGRAPAFLISLKAGGVGLNLTGADTVVHFDPWWNPAVEDQATDRAHRIGQTRLVTSYKLITRDTVEEKILQLQTRKRQVIRATLGGEEQLVDSLTWEEIQELFAG